MHKEREMVHIDEVLVHTFMGEDTLFVGTSSQTTGIYVDGLKTLLYKVQDMSLPDRIKMQLIRIWMKIKCITG